MITENLSTLKIHKLSQTQYDRELAAGNIDENSLYLTPDEKIASIEKGGTGATTAEDALANLGALSCSGGTITGNVNVNGATQLSTLIGKEGDNYGPTLPDAGTKGRIFFKKV